MLGNSITGVTYRIYRATNQPYLLPTDPPYATASDPFFTDPDAAVVVDTANSTAYLVTAINTAGEETTPSQRVGVLSSPIHQPASQSLR